MEDNIKFGDCLKLMKGIPDKGIDLILADLPYGVTKNKFDTIINPVLLWKQYERIIKDNGAILLFGQGIFSAKMILSNEKLYKYTLIWEKTHATGFLNAKRMPLRNHEDILVFYKKLPVYNPQKTVGHTRKVSTDHHKRNSKVAAHYGKYQLKSYDSTERYPKSVWKFKSDTQKTSLHPTQKPLELIKQLILTFSNPGDTVLDNVSGSGTTGIACIETNRKFILMENDPEMYEIGKKRIIDYVTL